MSDEECEHIIARAKREKMVASTVGAETALAQTTEQRTRFTLNFFKKINLFL